MRVTTTRWGVGVIVQTRACNGGVTIEKGGRHVLVRGSGPSRLGKRLVGSHPRDGLAQYEAMDVVRPLVRIDRLQVRHVTHCRILDENAVRSEQAAGFAC